MAEVGDIFSTGDVCETSAIYQFDGYLDFTTTPKPTQEESKIPLSAGETFPPIRSAKKGCWWKLILKA